MRIDRMKKFFMLVLVLIVFSLVGCNNKSKEIEKKEVQLQEQPINHQTYSNFYVERVAFNGAGHLIALFTMDLDKNQRLSVENFIQPKIENLSYEIYGNKLVFKGDFKKESPYTLTLDNSLLNINGEKLNNSYTFNNLYVSKQKPSLYFSDNASILSSLNNKRINFSSVNVKKVKLEVVKVYLNNITDFIKTDKENLYYEQNRIKDDLGDIVFSKEYTLENQSDEVIKNSVDLNGIIDKKGIYRIRILADEKESIDYDEDKYGHLDFHYWENDKRVYVKAEKNIILSDLGLIANSNSSKLDIKAININNLELVPNTKLQFISKKNQLLEEGVTNENGEYKTKINANEIFYIFAKNGDEYNILYLNESQLNYSDFNIGGIVEAGDLRLFTYTDKGYYRPGDEINVSLIARNKNKVMEDHPFTYSFTSPNGDKKINSVLVKESRNGFYTFKIKTDINDETGAWNLNIKFGDKELNKPIFIEAKVANRIAIDIDKKNYTSTDIDENRKLNIEVEAKYLNGLKASHSQTYYDSSITIKETESKKFKSFVFNNPTANFMINDNISGILDENGKEKLKINIPALADKYNLTIFISANVLDTNGRYSTESKKVELINKEFAIGLKNTSKENKVVVSFIVLDEKNDTLIANKKLKYRVFNKKYNWWYDSYQEGENYIKNSIDTVVTEVGEIISSNEIKSLELKSLESGINFVEFEDEETGISSGIFIYNYSYGNKAKNRMENLDVTFDKEKYQVGETAKLKFTGPIGAKALITIEKEGKILKEYWKNLIQKENQEDITIEKDFFPNAYATVSVYQKYFDKENDRPLRLYGSLPLMIKDASKELNLVVTSNDEAEPLSTYKLKISNKEQQKMYFQYLLVDEGVLRQREYTLPKPFEFFYGKQAKLVKNYDNFSNIIEKYSGKNIVNHLKTGGGDYEVASLKMAYKTNNMDLQGKTERFKNISIVSDILETDDKGYAEIDIKIPNYFGAMRIFVIASSDDKYGSLEKLLTIKAPVIIEASAPRVLKVGDKFTVPITLFPIENNLENGNLKVKYNEKEYIKEISFKDQGNQKFTFEFLVPEEVGENKIEVIYLSPKYNFKDEISINVDTPFAYQYIDKSTILKKGEEYKLSASEFKDFIPSTLKYDLILSSYENLGLNKIIRELLDYPYMCLEQTTSKAKAMLAVTRLTDNISEQNEAKNNLNLIIRKLFNQYQLSNGGFAYWPNSNYDDIFASIYTIDFILKARKQGYYIPEPMFKNSIAYLQAKLFNTDISVNTKVDILYLLASIGEPNIAEMNIIFDRYFKDLSLVFKWTLLDTYNLIGEEEFAKEEARKILNEKVNAEYTSRQVYYKSEILKHYISIFKEREESLFKDIVVSLKSNIYMPTFTQANVIEAIANSVRSIDKKDLSFVVVINGKEKELKLKNAKFDLKEISDFKSFKEIIVKNNSQDNLYLDFLVQGKPVKFVEKNESKNIKIYREFLDSNGEKIEIKNLKVGDRISMLIKTEIENTDYLENIVLLQILPSGLEIANDNNFDTLKNRDSEYNGNSDFDYIDIRDDRIAFFYEQYGNSYSEKPQKEVKINLNVVSAGEYYFPATKVEAMYDNNFRAYLKGFNIKVSGK